MNYSKITVYATTSCPYCTMVADWLDSKKVPYEKILVDHDRESAMDMVKKTGQMGVPVTEIQYPDRNPEYVIGFNQPQLSYMLGLN